jgi:hypothetical protein
MFRVPFEWVDRTDEMQPGTGGAASSATDSKPPTASGTGHAETLLAIFERPPGVSGEGVDSTVIIATESLADYPQVKKAADYIGPLAEIAEQHGLKMDGDAYGFPVGRKQLVRADFIAGSDKTAVRQTSLVTIEKGYIVSFTFVSASDDEIDNLIEGLSFRAPRRSRSHQ